MKSSSDHVGIVLELQDNFFQSGILCPVSFAPQDEVLQWKQSALKNPTRFKNRPLSGLGLCPSVMYIPAAFMPAFRRSSLVSTMWTLTAKGSCSFHGNLFTNSRPLVGPAMVRGPGISSVWNTFHFAFTWWKNSIISPFFKRHKRNTCSSASIWLIWFKVLVQVACGDGCFSRSFPLIWQTFN